MPPGPILLVKITARLLCTAALALALSAGSNLRAETIFVRVNQLGYTAQAPKTGLAFSITELPKTFSVEDERTRQVVFTGDTKPVTEATWGRFTHHVELPFGALCQPGRYVVRIGEQRSLPFAIGGGDETALPDRLLEFMRQQRCGYNPWLDAECHQLDGRTAYGPEPAGATIDARGGWHDAGDLLKYLLTSSNATAQLLLAHALSSDAARFSDHCDARGRPTSNGQPDLLDEARWGLDWLLKLHPAPDQLYHQVADDRDHCGWRLPQNEIADYGWGKGGARVAYFADGQPQGLRKFQSVSTGVANLAGRYAAAMALAFQIWKDDPAQRALAHRCLQAGREVYALGRAREGVQQGNSYLAPYRYEETTWADDMEWGAAELFRATREPLFLADATRYAQLAADEGWMGREQAGHYQFYPFMNVGHFRLHDLVAPELQATLAGYYRAGLERCRQASERNPYRIGVPFIWCSNNLVVALVTQGRLYERMTGDARYREFIAAHRDWLLGRNPWGTTMFTEVGAVFPRQVHLMTARLTKRAVCGGLVDGPVYERIFKTLKGVTIATPDPLAEFQGVAVYHDDLHDYSTNEPTMDGTAAAILMFALDDGPAR
ncbi:MAG: glycoside hydrolase family 9 protein [Opitutae bacterium]|nr:glycoside hydrolase family 9 protein [Opitutae bacterium]